MDTVRSPIGRCQIQEPIAVNVACRQGTDPELAAYSPQ
jgi:hypothetical protein